MKKLFNALKYAIPAIIIMVAFSYVSAAWTSAPATPPNSNTDAPLNVGNSDQVKLGSLKINSVIPSKTYGLDVWGISRFFGNIEIGTTAAPATLKIVDGNQADGKVLTSDASGNAGWRAAGGGSASIIAAGTVAVTFTEKIGRTVVGCTDVNGTFGTNYVVMLTPDHAFTAIGDTGDEANGLLVGGKTPTGFEVCAMGARDWGNDGGTDSAVVVGPVGPIISGSTFNVDYVVVGL